MKTIKKLRLYMAMGALVMMFSGCSLPGISEGPSAATPPESAGQAATEANEVLDLSGRNLGKLDMSVFERTELESLDVSNNNLSGALPSQIGNLKNLKVLDASGNVFTGVPAEVGHLSQLEILDLSDNKLTGLPYELGDLKNLRKFDISGNKFSEYDLNIIREKLPNTEFITD